MLWLRATNVVNPVEGPSEYSVSVGVNSESIWNGYVKHVRDKGAAQLLRDIADEMEGRNG